MAPAPYRDGIHHSLLWPSRPPFRSLLMQDILSKAMSLASLEAHTIVIGEIGSGKKRMARMIHQNSRRAGEPFHLFYCLDMEESGGSAMNPVTLYEEEETFRGGVLEKAEGGVLYLDQFSELGEEQMQRVIDSYMEGSCRLFRHNLARSPRLILSMNHDSFHRMLHTQVWYRILQQLDPVAIMLPPLRERREDIPLFIDLFLQEFREKHSDWRNVRISSQAICECFDYSWPGNIRQLKNAIHQAAILSYGSTIESRHLPFTMSWKLPYDR